MTHFINSVRENNRLNGGKCDSANENGWLAGRSVFFIETILPIAALWKDDGSYGMLVLTAPHTKQWTAD
jgi:hypothetical protein